MSSSNIRNSQGNKGSRTSFPADESDARYGHLCHLMRKLDQHLAAEFEARAALLTAANKGTDEELREAIAEYRRQRESLAEECTRIEGAARCVRVRPIEPLGF